MPRDIDWTKVKTIEDLEKQVSEAELFDFEDHDRTGGVYPINLRDDLNEKEIEDALFWYPFSRGLWLIIGYRGCGKDGFRTHIQELFRRLYGRRAIMDDKPRALFGEYIPFSLTMFDDQLKRIRYQTLVQSDKVGEELNLGEETDLKKLREEQKDYSGEIFLKNSTLHLGEFAKYHPRRNPNNPVTMTLCDFYSTLRHWDILVMGSTTKLADLEVIRLQPEISAYVYPKYREYVDKEGVRHGIIKAKFCPLEFHSATGTLRLKQRPFNYIIDIFKEREYLGGKAIKDLYNTKNKQSIMIRKNLTKGGL